MQQPGLRSLNSRAHAVLAAVAILAPVAGCALDQVATPVDDDVVFITQSVAPNAVMQALFVGTLTLDQAGCIRMESASDDATIVWPVGFTAERQGDAIRVRNGQGREVGRIPGPFRLGGGFVAELHDGIGLSATDRQRATGRCPGSYWITGEVLID